MGKFNVGKLDLEGRTRLNSRYSCKTHKQYLIKSAKISEFRGGDVHPFRAQPSTRLGP